MREFPVAEGPPTEIALHFLHARYSALNADRITTQLPALSPERFHEVFLSLASSRLHEYLFQGLLSNAGQFRKSTDQGGGRVYFGPSQRFQGVPPEEIAQGVMRACGHLSKESQAPLLSVTKFYQQFVFVHPYYDANGRIARFIMDTYLNFHEFSFSWGAMHSSTEWLKKLNDCHKRYPGPKYEDYIIRLASISRNLSSRSTRWLSDHSLFPVSAANLPTSRSPSFVLGRYKKEKGTVPFSH